jgi:hypothetical protein
LRIARPPEGFTIILKPFAEAALDGAKAAYRRMDDVWQGICERLKFTAHREGEPLPNGSRVQQFSGDPRFGVPRIALVYRVVGDAVTIQKLLISVS